MSIKSLAITCCLMLSVSLMWAQSSDLLAFNTQPIIYKNEVNTGLNLGITNKTSKTGKLVYVDVYAQNVVELLSMQYSMKWDYKVLKFKGVQEFGLPKFNAENFGLNNSNKGQLTLAWFDQNLRGITVPAGKVLYQLVFEVVGKTGSKGFINFTDYPTVIEVSTPPGQIIPFNAPTGSVKVQ